jgi:hypothetical protein
MTIIFRPGRHSVEHLVYDYCRSAKGSAERDDAERALRWSLAWMSESEFAQYLRGQDVLARIGRVLARLLRVIGLGAWSQRLAESLRRS